MKKSLILMSMMLCSGVCLSAQNIVDVRFFECEIGLGGILGNRCGCISSEPGIMFFVEPRFNIPCLPLDVSTQASIYGFSRGETSVSSRGSLCAFLDYNYRWKRVALFAGLGAGIASIDYSYPYVDEQTGSTWTASALSSQFVLAPRAGIELFNHLRLTVECRLITRYFSCAALNIGFAFGGGRRK
ncbi:MAG: hypothetical protein NC115_03775 [Bacteroidales bacterium]|nr:hypothetical protein [Bacteroidales bacterium]